MKKKKNTEEWCRSSCWAKRGASRSVFSVALLGYKRRCELAAGKRRTRCRDKRYITYNAPSSVVDEYFYIQWFYKLTNS